MNTKWKVILSIMLLLVSFCACFTAVFIQHNQDNIDHFITLQTEGIRAVTNTILLQTSTQYRKRIESFLTHSANTSRSSILNDFADHNREELLQSSIPFFDIFKNENPAFSTFAWILPNNTAFLLVHNPVIYGAEVSTMRPDIASANKKQRQMAGFSASPIGLQYRVVNPVYSNGQHIGALQFGINDSLFIDIIHETLQIPVGLVIPEKHFKYIKRSQLPSLNTGEFGIQSRQIDLFKNIFDKIDWTLEKQSLILHNKEHMLVQVCPLNNYANEPQGHIFVALDISRHIADARSHIIFTITLCCVLLTLTFFILYFSYGSLIRRITHLQVVTKVNRELEAKVAVRTKELEDNKNYLKSIFNAPNEAIFILDPETAAILDVNQGVINLYGHTYEEAILLQISDFSSNEPPYTQQQVEEMIWLATHETPQTFEWMAKRKNGTLFWVEVGLKLTTLRNQPYLIAVVRNIDAKKNAEKELLKVRKLESVGILAGGIAHDFNNILTAILGNIELAALLIGSDHKAFGLLIDSKKASFRAVRLTEQLLTFAKGGAPVKESASLPQLIQDSANFVLRGSSVSCNYVFPDDLWSVHADTSQLGQVIQNLILNGRQAMAHGGTILIRCANICETAEENILTAESGRFVKIVIRDSGIGIPDTIIDTVFDPYFSTKQKGSGLGLAICHSIIKKHKGHITVQSTPGKGTTFTVYLPALQEIAEDDGEDEGEGEDVRI